MIARTLLLLAILSTALAGCASDRLNIHDCVHDAFPQCGN